MIEQSELQRKSQDRAERSKILAECLEGFYTRYRKKFPSDADFAREVRAAIKDFEKVPIKNLKQMFAYAYAVHESKYMPINKEVIAYWKQNRSELRKETSSSDCLECLGSGTVSAYRQAKEYGERIRYAFKCACPNGQRMSDRFVVWDKYKHEQRGFEKV